MPIIYRLNYFLEGKTYFIKTAGLLLVYVMQEVLDEIGKTRTTNKS